MPNSLGDVVDGQATQKCFIHYLFKENPQTQTSSTRTHGKICQMVEKRYSLGSYCIQSSTKNSHSAAKDQHGNDRTGTWREKLYSLWTFASFSHQWQKGERERKSSTYNNGHNSHPLRCTIWLMVTFYHIAACGELLNLVRHSCRLVSWRVQSRRDHTFLAAWNRTAVWSEMADRYKTSCK